MLHDTRAKAAFAASFPPWAHPVGLAIAIGIAYFLAARLSLALLAKPAGVAVFWPAAGVAAGVLITVGSRARLPVIVGTVAATIVANVLGDRNIWSSIIFAVCNAGEAVLVAGLIERFFGSSFSLDSLQRVLGLLAACIIGAAISGVGGTLGYVLFHSSTASALTIWYHWFTSDAIGIMTVAPLLIGLFSATRDPPPRREVLEGTLALAMLTVLSGFVIHLPSQAWAVEVTITVLFPLLLWIAARCRPVFAAAATFISALILVWTTTFGIGIFGDPNLPIAERILLAQACILSLSLCALVLAALFAERRQHEAILMESEVQLQEALRVAKRADRAKSSFLAAASHDLRQPLQTLNLLQGALKRHIQVGEARTLLAGIERSVDVMNDMLTSFLDINRLESGTLSPSMSDFPINNILDSVAADFLVPVEEKGLSWRLVRSGTTVHSDRRMLEWMIRNLLSNAVRYTDRGRILVGCRRTGDMVRIEVWDSGLGITSEHIPRIFDEFYQVPENAQLGGFGLGLAIVQRLGKILDHHIDVRSTLGKGSGFSIDVPLGHEKANVADQSRAPPDKADVPFLGTILVIEDDYCVRTGLDMLLSSEGLGVVSAATGNEALALVAKKGLRPDLVISDFNLSGPMNGVESIEALRAALAWKIPALVLTGDIRSRVIDGIAEHDVGIAAKPLNADELLQLIHRLHAHSKSRVGN